MRRVFFACLILLFAFLAAPDEAAAQSCSPQDYCCGNNICDPGEDRANCAEDCRFGCNFDGVCEPGKGETPENCPSDCLPPPPPVCDNDGICEPGETPENCPNDCTPGSPICGNGIPEPGEDCSNCEQDVALKPTFTVSPSQPTVGQPVTFTADSNRINNPPEPLWNLGNGDHRSGNPLVYSYQAPGTYEVVLTANERNCGSTQFASQSVTVGSSTPSNRPPLAHPGGPYSGKAHEAIVFDGWRSSDPDGTIVEYRWNFGDGVASIGRIVPHSYLLPGTYTVTLTVTDNGGLKASASTTATIAPSDFSGRFAVSQEFLPYNSNLDELTASASMTILAPDSMTYRPQLRVVIRDPRGGVFDTGLFLVNSPFTRTFKNPAAGTWSMTVEYYFTHRQDPTVQPIRVETRTSSGYVSAQPSPRIEGPTQLWWFAGATWYGNTPTQITLYAYNVPGPCSWKIERGIDKVRLVSASGCNGFLGTATFQSIWRSSFPRDVSIRVESAGRTSDPFDLTVYAPYRVDDVGFPVDSALTGGFESRIDMRLRDQFGGAMGGTPIEERFGAVINRYPTGNNWNVPSAGQATTFVDGYFYDRMYIYGCTPTSCTPMPVSPSDPASWDLVRDIDQVWRAGPGGAIPVRRNIHRWYRGRGRHEGVVSPVF